LYTESIFDTFAHGKLLISGEYFVLGGAWALAMPVRYGQTLEIFEQNLPKDRLSWTSKDETGACWFEAHFAMQDLEILSTTDAKTAATLLSILKACRVQNTRFLTEKTSLSAFTQTDFPRAWGLGSSSTLIAAVAHWAGVDPYPVLFETLGGSGYDIACAYADKPLLYRLADGKPETQAVDFQPSFSKNLYFVYLGQKQDSRAGIRRYRENAPVNNELNEQVSDLSLRFLNAQNLSEFEQLIAEHEHLTARTLGLQRAKDLYFRDFWGEIKSLGAWGGDFILAAGERNAEETKNYFNSKGFRVFIPFQEMIAPSQPSIHP
jgi:mevalonate kinase